MSRWVRVTSTIGGSLGEFPPSITRDGVVLDLYVKVSPCGGLEGTAETTYFRRISVADLVPELRRRVEAAIPEPATTFTPWDEKFGWTYVNVPVDFRVIPAAVTVVSLSNSLSNGLTSVSATLTATPTVVTFSPGEPKGLDVSCSTDDALAPYVAETPGVCSYRYRNSSAIAANGRTFSVTIAVTWTMRLESSEGSRDLDPFERTWTHEIGVAEVQALVTCTGPLPEQGGC